MKCRRYMWSNVRLLAGILISLLVLFQASFMLDKMISNTWPSYFLSISPFMRGSNDYVMRDNGDASSHTMDDKAANAITIENRAQGTKEWYVNNTDESWLNYPYQPVLLEGFTHEYSHFPGDKVNFKIDVAFHDSFTNNLAKTIDNAWVAKVDVQIYRLGYYNGDGARLVDVPQVSIAVGAEGLGHRHKHHFFNDGKDFGGKDRAKSYIHSQEPCDLLAPRESHTEEHAATVVDCANWKSDLDWTIPFDLVTGLYVAVPVLAGFGENVKEKYTSKSLFRPSKSVGGGDDRQDGPTITMKEVVGSRGVYIPFIVKHPRLSPFFGRPQHNEDAKFDAYTGSGSGVGAGKGTVMFRTADLTWTAYNKYGGWNMYQGPKKAEDGQGQDSTAGEDTGASGGDTAWDFTGEADATVSHASPSSSHARSTDTDTSTGREGSVAANEKSTPTEAKPKARPKVVVNTNGAGFRDRSRMSSYNRPQHNRLPFPLGQAQNHFMGSEYPALHYLERLGYDILYIGCEDAEVLAAQGFFDDDKAKVTIADSLATLVSSEKDGNLELTGQQERKGHRAQVMAPSRSAPAQDFHRHYILLSVGHDEYWTDALLRMFLEAREHGHDIAFWSGNEAFWRVKWGNAIETAKTQTSQHRLDTLGIHSRGGTAGGVMEEHRDHLREIEASRGKGRLVYCNKDSIDIRDKFFTDGTKGGSSNSGSRAWHDDGEWTGTFYDPIQPGGSGEDAKIITTDGVVETPSTASSKTQGRGGNNGYGSKITSSLSTLLTGQYFMVNAYRSDALHVPANMARSRFWRDTDILQPRRGGSKSGSTSTSTSTGTSSANAVTGSYSPRGWDSYEGILGYEWDATASALCGTMRPKGLFPLSDTSYLADKSLVQGFGYRYAGSGSVTHQLTMYRHYSHLKNSVTPKATKYGQIDGTAVSSPRFRTSLVFAAGTIQWSWGLSTWHDGDHITRGNKQTYGEGLSNSRLFLGASRKPRQFGGKIPPVDPVLQQATMNLLADMGALPTTLPNMYSYGLSRDSQKAALFNFRSSVDSKLALKNRKKDKKRGKNAPFDASTYQNPGNPELLRPQRGAEGDKPKPPFRYAMPTLNEDVLAPRSYITAASHFLSKDDIPPAKRGADPTTTVQAPLLSSAMKASASDQGQAGNFDQGEILVVQGYASDISVDRPGGATGIVTAVEVTLDNGATWQSAIISAYTSLLVPPSAVSTEGTSDPQAALWQIVYPINRQVNKHSTLVAGYSIATQDHHHWGPCSTTINISPSERCDHLTKITILARAIDDSGWIEEQSPTFTVAIPSCKTDVKIK